MRTVLWGTRVTWRKLDCLNPNLQEMEVHIRRKDTRNRRRPCDVWKSVCATSGARSDAQ